MSLATSQDFLNMILSDTPIIDVRAPIEFKKGSVPCAVNLPIMSNEERALIGTCFKQKGRQAAIDLGYQTVSDGNKADKIKAWQNHLNQFPDSYVMCFRGGLRSKIAQTWIHENTPYKPIRLEGGYKAYRNFLLQAFEPNTLPKVPLLLGGHTGAGKTHILKTIDWHVDLEGLAKHRGSSFGQTLASQPSQVDFENALAQRLYRLKHQGYNHLLFELEAKNIGRVMVPPQLRDYFNKGQIVLVDSPLKDRIATTFNEYVVNDLKDYISHHGQETGTLLWQNHIQASIKKLSKKLGLQDTKEVLAIFDQACKQTDLSGHNQWIAYLLNRYYDPMYTYQRQFWQDKIIFEGSARDVKAFLKTYDQKNSD